MRPCILFVGHTRYDLPLSQALQRKWDAVAQTMDIRIVAEAGRIATPDPRFRLLRPHLPGPLGNAAFFAALPFVVLAESWRRPPRVIVAQSPYEGACIALVRRLLRRPVRIVVEVHGDWRSATRLYGRRRRRLLAPLADRVALFGLRRADATRALSDWTSGLALQATGQWPVAAFPTFSDLGTFLAAPPVPPPAVPRVIWVGALQPVKNVAALVELWPRVAAAVPEAVLTVVGDGPLAPDIDGLAARHPGRVTRYPSVSAAEVSALLDDATVLVLPSLSEGLGRVILEAFARGRPVVASDVGGIRDLPADGANGWLVAPGDHDGFAAALVRTLEDPALAERLGAAGRAWVERQPFTARGYAAALRELVDRVLDGADRAVRA
jgi:glycosyltransferase involved in cell wall biosynthesis